jgi:hypothetical protein
MRLRAAPRRAAVPLATVLLFVAIVVTPSAAASRPPGTRVTVGMFGDSVTESAITPDFMKNGLVPQLSRAVTALGFAPGGVGLVPAVPRRWTFNAATAIGYGPIPTNGWLTLGVGPSSPDFDGPSGYSDLAISPLATATPTVTDPDVEILYTSTGIHCRFTVTAAGRSWTIDTFRSGPAIDTGTSIELPPGHHTVTVHGPSSGALLFEGAVVQRPVQPGKVQVEIDNLGHTGLLPWGDFFPRQQQWISQERYDISVLMWGYIAEAVGGQQLAGHYLPDLIARARTAREHGGACLVVAPTPLEAPQSSINLVSNLDRTAARVGHCMYSTVLTHLWSSPAAAKRRGLVIADGIHPTAAGYTLIAHALAPVIAKLVRAHLGQ